MTNPLSLKPDQSLRAQAVINVVVGRFERKRSNEEMHDLFGTEELGTYIRLLQRFDLHSYYWDQIADAILSSKRISGLGYQYWGVMSELAPYVSSKMRGRIVSFFAHTGYLDEVVRVTTGMLHRKPTEEEFLAIAQCWAGSASSSTSDEERWTGLCNVAQKFAPSVCEKIWGLYQKKKTRDAEPSYY